MHITKRVLKKTIKATAPAIKKKKIPKKITTLLMRGSGATRATNGKKLDTTKHKSAISLNPGNIDPSPSPALRGGTGVGMGGQKRTNDPHKLQQNIRSVTQGYRNIAKSVLTSKLKDKAT